VGLLRRTPAGVRELVEAGERVLAWAEVQPAGYLPVPQMMRLPWDLISKATFSEAAVLVVEARPDPGARDRSWRVVLAEAGTLATVVYERVTSSVVVSERVLLQGDLGARIVARRAGDGLRWTVTFDAGLDARDPALRAEADAALAELRSTLGV
jgi:hypothetical protein